MTETKIEWADRVWNPVTGCTKVSEGCRNCYADRLARRLAGRCGYPKDAPFRVTLHPEKLDDPLRWKKPARVFVNSMSDLFHKDVPFEFIDRVFAVMAEAHRHTFIVLTKRPERMLEYMSGDRYSARRVFDLTSGLAGKFDCDLYWPLPNVWLGVSAENQASADERIPLLLQTPAAVRFVSCEPMLGPINLSPWVDPRLNVINRPQKLDWLICGGESGPGARPMNPDWARSLRDQCQAAGVSFYFKQWGEWWPTRQKTQSKFFYPGKPRLWCWDDGSLSLHIGKHKAGSLLDGQEYKQFPEVRE